MTPPTSPRCGGSGKLASDFQYSVPCPGCPDCSPDPDPPRSPTTRAEQTARVFDYVAPPVTVTLTEQEAAFLASLPNDRYPASAAVAAKVREAIDHTPPESGTERDCGDCGAPAATERPVCDGYSVPRCIDHQHRPAYQAESRLAQALSALQATERERDEAEARSNRFEEAVGRAQFAKKIAEDRVEEVERSAEALAEEVERIAAIAYALIEHDHIIREDRPERIWLAENLSEASVALGLWDVYAAARSALSSYHSLGVGE